MLDRNAILKLADEPLPVERVAVPEWGGDVFVRTLTCKERDDFEARCAPRIVDGKERPGDLKNLRGRQAALVLCDEKGKRLFTDDDAGQLGDMSVKAVERVLEAARRLNGLTDESVEEAKGN